MDVDLDAVGSLAGVPDGAVVTAGVVVAGFIYPDGGQGWSYDLAGSSSYSDLIGLLEIVKADMASYVLQFEGD